MKRKDYSQCPKCKSTKIITNRDLFNPFIKCSQCGYYLRDGDILHRNSPKVKK